METIGNQKESLYAKGWYSFATSANIKKGKIYSFNYFGTSFICIRNMHNDIMIFDAYCPHMGAHLGMGGKIIDDQIICPFHGWQYDFSGKCIHIPYCKKIPQRARLRSYPNTHLHDHIYIFYGPFEEINSLENELPLLARYRFNILQTISLNKAAWLNLIECAKLDCCVLLQGVGCVILEYENSYLRIVGTPINQESIQVSFAYTPTKHNLLLYLSLRIKLQRKIRELIHRITYHDISLSIHSLS